MSNIPIFVITYERLNVLKRSLDSFNRIGSKYQVIIHDNGSEYPDTVRFLEWLESNGTPVYRYWRIKRKEELNRVGVTVNDYFKKNKRTNYIVTDCDIELCDGCYGLIKFYSYMLDVNPDLKVIGPSLIIDDIPNHYPLKDEVLKRHKDRFWTAKRDSIYYNQKKYEYLWTHIDTSFAMYRAGVEFSRHMKGIRTFHPFVARHLDWYINPSRMTKDQRFYSIRCSKDINHWSNV